MSSVVINVDDKYVPLYRIMWISEVPHFCGSDDCTVEGRYEVRLEHDESVWATREERDEVVSAVERWGGGTGSEGSEGSEEEEWR